MWNWAVTGAFSSLPAADRTPDGPDGMLTVMLESGLKAVAGVNTIA